MPKIDQPIEPQEFLDGLKQLEKDGYKLPSSAESILNQVIVNTSKQYAAKKSNKSIQPLNAKEAKMQASKILRANMEAAKRSAPDNTDAHHIVPAEENRLWAKEKAEAARRILKRWNIDINHEANGVYLPSKSSIPVEELPNAYAHKKVHTKVYYLNIASHLATASSRANCLEMLREIGEDLEDGTYPIRKGQTR